MKFPRELADSRAETGKMHSNSVLIYGNKNSESAQKMMGVHQKGRVANLKECPTAIGKYFEQENE